MPEYTYLCWRCEHKETKQRRVVKRDDPVECTVCADSHAVTTFMDRMVAAPAFHLKGSCWARDNYSTVLGDDPRYSKDKGFIPDE